MSSCQFDYDDGMARALWGDPPDISFEFDLLHTDRRSGETTGEVSITVLKPQPAMLHRAKVRLDSTRGKTELTNHLKKRAPDSDLDWDGMVEEACIRTLNAHRTGEPAVILRDVAEPTTDVYLVRPLALDRHPSMLFGDGGTAKSYLALALGISIHTGVSLFPGLEVSQRKRVAYLDWELDAAEHRRRLRLLCGGRFNMPDIVYVRCATPLREDVDRLRRIFREHQIEYAIADSVAWACGGDAEASESATSFEVAWRRLNVGGLWLAHITKHGEGDTPFGSIFWTNAVRTTWKVVKSQEESDEHMSLGFFNKKPPVNSQRAKPLGFRLRFEAQATLIDRVDVRDDPTLSQGLSLGTRVYDALLANGQMTYGQLAEQLEADERQIRMAVARGRGIKFTVVPGEGKAKLIGALAQSDVQHDAQHVAHGSGGTLPTPAANGSGGEVQHVALVDAHGGDGGSATAAPPFRGGGGRVAQPTQPSGERGKEGVDEDGPICPGCHAMDYEPLADGRRRCNGCGASWGRAVG